MDEPEPLLQEKRAAPFGIKNIRESKELSRISSVYGSDYQAALKEPAYSVSKTSFTSSH